MKIYCADEKQKLHDPQFFLVNGQIKSSPENPERIDELLIKAKQAGHEVVAPDDHGLGPVSAIHTPQYLQFLETIHERWQRMEGASSEVVPGIQPGSRDLGYPDSAIGQAGYHMADTACPIGKGTWESALWSANSAVSATKAVLDGEKSTYALCRPPGHHAFTDRAGGFCFINNSAVAAQCLRQEHDRVAIIDVDLHHGNGTQGIFYARDDVMTVSIHADPIRFYPFFWGYGHERGEGKGVGYNLNLPLDRGTGDEGFLKALDTAIKQVNKFSPSAIVIALGLDAFEGDPFAGLKVSTQGFANIAEKLASMNLPTVIVQEGGYLCDELGDNLVSFLDGFNKGSR